MTASTNLEPEQVQSAESIESPGARLRKERQSQGLDQARIAAQLHLSESMIEALEWDDFNALPGTVFVQGYLRNYARLLGLPEKEILDPYQRLCPEPDEGCLSSTTSGSVTREVRSSHGMVQLVTWSIVIGLIVLLFIWWQGRLDWEAEPMVEVSPDEVMVQEQLMQDEVLLEQMPTLTLPTEEKATARFGADATEPMTTDSQLESGVEETQSEAEAVTEQAGFTVTDAPPLEEPELPVSVAEIPLPTAEAGPLTEPAAETQQGPQPVRELEFEFKKPCWTQVRDASGKAQIIGEMRAGTRRTLDASLGPFRITLGNVAGAKLSLDGEPFDLTPYTEGNVARFTLDPANP
ncbi:MAG: RodZ domain-containing protein [Pseudomonadota bacterium]